MVPVTGAGKFDALTVGFAACSTTRTSPVD
jgi:hypothetical protein